MDRPTAPQPKRTSQLWLTFPLLVAAFLAPPAATRAASLAGEDAEQALSQLGEGADVRLSIAGEPGMPLTVDVRFEDAALTLDLAPYSVRAPGFRVEVRGAGGRVSYPDPGPERTFSGAVRGLRGSRVVGSYLEEGLVATLVLRDGTTLWLEPARRHDLGAEADRYDLGPCRDDAGQHCGTPGEVKDTVKGIEFPKLVPGTDAADNCAALGGCVADLLCDSDYGFFEANGSSVAQAQATIEALVALMVPRFQEPFKITHRISGIVVRSNLATDPYSTPPATVSGELNERLREQWPQSSAFDLVHLFTTQSFLPIVGVGEFGGVCGPTRQSWSSGAFAGCQRAGLLTHELAHNWGANHTASGLMSFSAGDCNSPWTGNSLTEVANLRNILDGICLDLANLAPAARFSFTCSGLACNFDASASSDDHGIASFAWAFGDATTGSGATPGHSYAATGAFTATLTVTDTHGLTNSVSRKISVNGEAPVAAERYFAVTPCRVFDSRPANILSHGQLRNLAVTGLCGIPSTAKAVSVNVTAISPTGGGFFALYPGNQSSGPFPHAELNFDASNSPRSNNALVRLATNGAGTLNLLAGVAGNGQVHATVDVSGYFSEDAFPAVGARGPLGYQTLTPCRIADTRGGAPVGVGVPRSFSVQGFCGVPVGAGAAMFNTVMLQSTAGGHARFYEAAVPPPVPTLNFNTGATVANGARIRLAPTMPDLTLDYYSPAAGATTHAILDLFGYFKSDAPLLYRPITACRAIDTRSATEGAPVLAAGSTRTFQIRGNCGVPTTARAVAVNLATAEQAGDGFLVAYPAGTPLPLASLQNFTATSGAISNGAILALSTSSPDLAVTTSTGTQVIVDVFGYFE